MLKVGVVYLRDLERNKSFSDLRLHRYGSGVTDSRSLEWRLRRNDQPLFSQQF